MRNAASHILPAHLIRDLAVDLEGDGFADAGAGDKAPVGFDGDDNGRGHGHALPGHAGKGIGLAAHAVAVLGLNLLEGKKECHGRGETSITFWNFVTTM